ncbi:MAG: septum formation family protein [Rhodoglobus sp.]
MSIKLDKFWVRALAVASVGAASIALAGCSLLGNVANNGSTDQSTGEGTDSDVFSIKVGDCLNDGDVEGEVSSVPITDCAKPHDSEAFKSILMADGDFPGDDAVTQQAIDGCTAAFTDFVGIDYDSSSLDFSYYFPTSDSWAQGDREILCLAIDPNGQTTGTLAGAAR